MELGLAENNIEAVQAEVTHLLKGSKYSLKADERIASENEQTATIKTESSWLSSQKDTKNSESIHLVFQIKRKIKDQFKWLYKYFFLRLATESFKKE